MPDNLRSKNLRPAKKVTGNCHQSLAGLKLSVQSVCLSVNHKGCRSSSSVAKSQEPKLIEIKTKILNDRKKDLKKKMHTQTLRTKVI